MTTAATPAFITTACEIFPEITPETFRKSKLNIPLSKVELEKLNNAIDSFLVQFRQSEEDSSPSFSFEDSWRALVLQRIGYPRSQQFASQPPSPIERLFAFTYLSIRLHAWRKLLIRHLRNQIPETLVNLLSKTSNFTISTSYTDQRSNKSSSTDILRKLEDFPLDQIVTRIGRVQHKLRYLRSLEKCKVKLISSLNKELITFMKMNATSDSSIDGISTPFGKYFISCLALHENIFCFSFNSNISLYLLLAL